MSFILVSHLRKIALAGLFLPVMFQSPLYAEVAQKDKNEASVIASENLKEEIKDAVVKVIVVSHVVDKKEPWNSSIRRSTGSGFLIEGKRILTNAHVISNATFIEVQKQAETERYEAEVINVSHEADLAILELKEDKPEFFNTKILEFGGLPKLQKEVSAYGYPTGGTGLSITKGVVSRIERKAYVHKGKHFISVQIDAAINPGNSGGPVLSEGQVVGVVMQSRLLSQNIGYMIPVPVIKHFLTDIEDGKYDGFPSLGVDIEKIESPVIRKMYGINDDQSGVLVTMVYPDSPAEGKIQKNDIITAIEGHDISNNGKAELRHKELISFQHYVDMQQLGENLSMSLIRDGKPMEVAIQLDKDGDAFHLVSPKQFERPPSYFVYGGFVFMPLTADYISANKGRFSGRLGDNITVLKQFWPTKERTQAVILTKVLPDDSNKGFHNISNMLVDTLNGEKFKNFSEFHNMITESDSEFVVLEDQFGFQVVIDRQLAVENQKEILKRYNIAEGESEDLKVQAAQNDSEKPAVVKETHGASADIEKRI